MPTNQHPTGTGRESAPAAGGETGAGKGRPLPRLRAVPDTDPPALTAAELLEHSAGQTAGAGTAGEVAGQVAGQMVLALHTGTAPRWAPLADDLPEVAARAAGHAHLPDPAPVCTALAVAVVEVFAGRRALAQLTRWTTEDVHRGLARRAALATRIQQTAPHTVRPVPGTPGPTRTPTRTPGQRPAVVRRVRITHPADGVVEAAAVVLDTHRVRAIALRLEGWDTRWRLTALELG